MHRFATHWHAIDVVACRSCFTHNIINNGGDRDVDRLAAAKLALHSSHPNSHSGYFCVVEDWKSRWVVSSWKQSEGTAGEWKLAAGTKRLILILMRSLASLMIA